MSGVDDQKQPFNPLLALLAALAALFFVFPLIGLITGAPWGRMTSVITSKSSLDALGLSIIASLSSTVIALLFGFPLAWLLARGRFRGKAVVRGLTTLPMVLPPVVGGIALLLAYGRRGFIGEPLDKATGISLPFTLAGVIVAESFVAMPFFVITVESGLRAASSSRWLIDRNPDSTVITKNGIATNDSATITPARVNGSVTPVALSSGLPMNPLRP